MSTRVTRRSSTANKLLETERLDVEHTRKWMTTRRTKLITIDSDLEDNIENINTSNKMDPPKTPKTPKTRQRRRKLPNLDSSESADEIIPTTPPKQTKVEPTQSPTSKTPSKLLNKLCLNSPPGRVFTTDDSSDVEDEKKANFFKLDKYQNAKKVLNSGETHNLPGREAEINKLTTFLNDNLNNGTSASMYISGPPGTGKTACLSMLLASPMFEKRLTKVYINCTSIASIGSIYKKICASLKLDSAGTEKASHLAIEKYLSKQHKHVLLVLDEIDQLCGKRQSILYTIFEWPAKPNSKLILIGIANALDLTDRALARLNAKCELKPQLMHYAPYSKQQICTIFKSRLEDAGLLEIFPPITIQLLAGKVAALSGDVRRALDIGRRVVEMASEQKRKGAKVTDINLKDLGVEPLEEEEKMKPVQMNQVVSVLNNVYGASQTLSDDLEDAFPLQQKILICTFLLMLKTEKNKDITLGRLHDMYKRVCGKRNIQCVDQTEFVGLCSLVETRGILRLVKKKEARLSKILLQWDEQEVTEALRDKQLIASILAEQNIKSR